MFRFDFSHFQKLTEEEIREVEKEVNSLIRKNIALQEFRSLPIAEAEKMGAMMLFGEKYGEDVRVIRFGDSVELCGGIHARATGQLGFFKILRESSIAAGIRRIEAVTGIEAERYIYNQLDTLSEISTQLEKHSNILDAVKKLVSEHSELNKEIAAFRKDAMNAAVKKLHDQAEKIGKVNFIAEILPMADADMMRDAAFRLKNEINDLVLVLGGTANEKALLVIMISDNLVAELNINASQMIREVAKEIQGGGGGQPFFATAGGKNPGGLDAAIAKAKEIVRSVS